MYPSSTDAAKNSSVGNSPSYKLVSHEGTVLKFKRNYNEFDPRITRGKSITPLKSCRVMLRRIDSRSIDKNFSALSSPMKKMTMRISKMLRCTSCRSTFFFMESFNEHVCSGVRNVVRLPRYSCIV